MKTQSLNNSGLVSAVILFFGFFCVYMTTVPGQLPEGDEAILLGVADRIGRFGFSWLPPGVNETSRFSSYGFFKDGFSKYGIGQSLLLIPSAIAFKLADRALSANEYFSNTIMIYIPGPPVAAGTVALFSLVCRRLGYEDKVSWVLSLILGFSTMIWPYSQTLFSDPTLGFLWLLAFYNLLVYRESRQSWRLALAGVTIGFAVLVKIVAAYAVPLFCGYFLYAIWNGNSKLGLKKLLKVSTSLISIFLLPMVLMGFALLWYNQLRYGSYFAFGYLDMRTYDARDTLFGFKVPFLAGFYAQFLSSGKGFFFYNPSTILGLGGWKSFYKKCCAEAFFCLAMIVGMLVIYSKWYGWHGDWCWGLRYWSCMPPFFMIAAAPVLENILKRLPSKKKILKRTTIIFLIVLSVGVQVLGLSVKSNDYILTASEADVFKGKFFGPGWPVRDDSMQLHFIPEFSPLAGHWWMMRVIMNRDNPKLKAIFESPPWISLNSEWVPQKINPNRFRYNIWWLHAWASNTKGINKLFVFFGFIFTMALVALATGLGRAFKVSKAPSDIKSEI